MITFTVIYIESQIQDDLRLDQECHSETDIESFMHLSMLSLRVGGGGGYLREIGSESFPLGRDFDTSTAPGSGI